MAPIDWPRKIVPSASASTAVELTIVGPLLNKMCARGRYTKREEFSRTSSRLALD